MNFTMLAVDKTNRTLDGSSTPVTRQKLLFPHLSIDCHTRSVEANGVPVRLTASEFKILYLLACSVGETLSAKEIYNFVWQMDDFGNIATVRTHISNLRRKLIEACPEHVFIACTWKKGYQFLPN